MVREYLKQPKRSKTQTWEDKFMASMFWDEHGFIFIDYLEKNAYYGSIRAFERGHYSKTVTNKKMRTSCLDNTQCHNSLITIAELLELFLESLSYRT